MDVNQVSKIYLFEFIGIYWIFIFIFWIFLDFSSVYFRFPMLINFFWGFFSIYSTKKLLT